MKYEKMSAGMAALTVSYESHGAANALARSSLSPLAAAGRAGAAPLVRVFLHCDPHTPEDRWEEHGIVVHQASGKIRTATLPMDKVSVLAEDAAVERISPARRLQPLLDVATKKAHVDAFLASSKLNGQGVVVGIVDSGVDASHPSFAGRVLSIWDQTIQGAGWGTTHYGTVLTGPTLSLGTDQNGHGTHVAGIAAGACAPYLGIATQASLIAVKTDFQDTSIADGVRYVFSEARRLNKPAVVNLSLGGHGDPHDGTDDLSRVIDQETGPGRIVVAAAGNEGDAAIHGAVDVAPGASASLRFRVTPSTSSGAAPWVILNGWYSGATECRISVRTSTGEHTPAQGVLAGVPPVKTYHLKGASIQVTTPPPAANPNQDHQFLIELRPGTFANAVQGGTWTLTLENVGTKPCRIDAWSIVPENASPAVFLGAQADLAMKIGSPGTAASATTVAAYTTRNTWISAAGATLSVGLAEDDICDFSSPGPLRNGAAKPDVAAPGAMLISALSAQSSPDARYLIDDRFRVDAGTSMASPFIAGIAALLLQRNPSLDPAGVKAALKRSSLIPGRGVGTFDPKWGYGLIDATNL